MLSADQDSEEAGGLVQHCVFLRAEVAQGAPARRLAVDCWAMVPGTPVLTWWSGTGLSLQDFYDYGDEEGDEQMAQGE